jgi:hypothetical protein
VVGSGYDHGIDLLIVQDFAQVSYCLFRLESGAAALGPAFIDIASIGHPGIGLRGEAASQGASLAPAADHGHDNSLIGPGDRSPGTGFGQSQGAGQAATGVPQKGSTSGWFHVEFP